ncbi:MAG: VWA domain-containing protein, partial [Phycisphaeraceae bacterium]|nr:VWA domain-containing protein [Phycisphaeraceae bacterium]
MDFAHPWLLLLIPPAIGFVVWASWHSTHPMPPRRRRALMAVRSILVALTLLALSGPALQKQTGERAVVFILDHSQSMGTEGWSTAVQRANALAEQLPAGTHVGFLSAGKTTHVHQLPERRNRKLEPTADLIEVDGMQTDLAGAVDLAKGLFPPGASRRVVLLTDGQETRGDLATAARHAALGNIVIDALPVTGPARPDVRVVGLRPSRFRLNEGATLKLRADLDSSLTGSGRVRLFENGVEVDSKKVDLKVGQSRTVRFQRTPDRRNLYKYRVRAEGFAGDTLPTNNEAMTLVEVRGRPLILYIEGEPGEAHYLADAMRREGIELETRPAEALPDNLQDLSGYDGLVISDTPAFKLSEKKMHLIRDYVEQLGGGFMMIGGTNAFGVGGYYRTPIEEILPVKIKAPDKEQRHSVALAVVIDRSGSMGQQKKIELSKSAAVGTV